MKPCPFCNCTTTRKEKAGQGFYWACINSDCQATGPWDLGESGATEKWDIRPIEDELRNASIELLHLVEEHGSRILLSHAKQILGIRQVIME